MNLADAMRGLRRLIGGGGVPAVRDETIAFSSDLDGMREIFCGTPVYAGVAVTERTAMCVSAAYACTRLISGAIASMPVEFYRRTNGEREMIDHDLWWLMNESPSAQWTSASWWEYVLWTVLLRGDSFSEILRSGAGKVTEFVPHCRDAVTVEATQARELVYYVNDGFRKRAVVQESMLHFTGFGFDGVRSQSVITHHARQSIGTAIAADEFSGRFFANGGTPRVVLSTDKKMTDEGITELRRQWMERYGGGENAFMPLVLTQGLAAKELNITAQDAQLLETRKFEVIDIARFFGVPPHMIGETEKASAWGSGLEHMSTGFVQYTLRPHLNRIEQEINRKLFHTAGTFCKFDEDELRRGDLKARGEYYRQAIGGSMGPGWMTADEIRAQEDMPPLPNGAGEDRYTGQVAATGASNA